jgi:serine protease inhibitor
LTTYTKAVAVVLVAFLFLAGCDLFTGPGKGRASWSKVALDERVTNAYGDFGFELFRQLRATDPTGNIFISPTSAALALVMTYNGAVGQTADEMAHALGIAALDRTLVNETNRTWIDALLEVGDPAAELAIANSVWYRESYPIRDSFREVVTTWYHAAVEPITTAAVINKWVEQQTRGRIREIIDGEIPANVVAYLINALYFRADWTYQFDPAATRDGPFLRLDGTQVTVPMMTQLRAFETRADAELSMLRLPFGAGRFSMVLALPGDGHDLGTIAERLDAARWRAWMGELRSGEELEVWLPRFEMAWAASLMVALQAMGMDVPFEPGMADFSDMFEEPGPWIHNVIQRTFLKVDEKGATATAVTSVILRDSPRPSMVFDRPFFLAIYDHATDTVLFLGQVTDPTA